MTFAGNESGAELLGIFQVSILHNIVHLLFGVGILMARTHEGALNYLLGAGVIYVVLFVYGLFVGDTSDANFVPINNADDWLAPRASRSACWLVLREPRPRRTGPRLRAWGEPTVRPTGPPPFALGEVDVGWASRAGKLPFGGGFARPLEEIARPRAALADGVGGVGCAQDRLHCARVPAAAP